MITFLPHPDFRLSAAVLDPQRLRKQRAEVIAILEGLDGSRHPAYVMWRGHRAALGAYGLAIVDEIEERGWRDNSRDRIARLAGSGELVMPRWLGSEPFHSSHRGNLLRKDPGWYGMFGWTDSPLLPYVWPVNYDPRLFWEPR